MRELKFRAYSNKFKGMIYESKTYHIDVMANTVWKDLIDDESPILMQYTGLKDRNEIELYEGDIVKELRGDGKIWRIGRIEFDYTGARYISRVDSNPYYVRSTPEHEITPSMDDGIIDKPLWDMERPIEIIGNIYENPELLK